jgi:60 kDa SS-A/Ro ribonucleoprotein
MSYLAKVVAPSPAKVPQSAPLKRKQVKNNAGGYVFEVDVWARLRRFLVLGAEGGTYYVGERDLVNANVDGVVAAIATDGLRAVREIVDVSDGGRAPKNDPAILALALCASAADVNVRRAALDALPRVCRTSTHLFGFLTFCQAYRGWGRTLRTAVGEWYANKPVDDVAYQVVKYRQRDGWTHRDVLRLAHPGSVVSKGNPVVDVSPAHSAVFDYVAHGKTDGPVPRIIEGFQRAQGAQTPAEAAAIVRDYGLPRECVKSEHLTDARVWEALLPTMPLTATIRNLATMTRVGLLAPGSDATHAVVNRLADRDYLLRSRVHPVAVLAAMLTYASGRSVRGETSWAPVPMIVDALDAAFYASFGNVVPTGKRLMLAIDCSGSMGGPPIAGVPGLSPRVAAGALALVTASVESAYRLVTFTASASVRGGASPMFGGYQTGITELPLSARQRLDDVCKIIDRNDFGATDCALPMLYAAEKGYDVDCFVIITDNETWAGGVHPTEALRQYRAKTGIPARLVVVGMTSTGFTIADPDDAGQIDIVGFDTATPQLISDFAAGLV